MSSRLYAQPIKVYVLLGVLAAAGLLAGWELPISLFPNSAKPVVHVNVDLGSWTASEFQDTYGNDLESALRRIEAPGVKVEQVESTYWESDAAYNVSFVWNTDPDTARREVETAVAAWSPRLPAEMRDTVGVWSNNENSGFLAVSFYSDERSLDELYSLLDAALSAKISAVTDADSPMIWNPASKEVRLELKPEALAALGLVPRDVERAVSDALTGRRGGTVQMGPNRLRVEMPRTARKSDDLAQVPIVTPSGKVVHVADVASVDFAAKSTESRLIKTSGAPSVMLFASPRPGGNVKRMSEDLLAIVDQAMPNLPKDIRRKVLVDPSQFIRASIANVLHEVAIGALLAVSVLFVFIGSFKNVVTAAVEIPLSIVLAFILMKLTGVNINLISLGGLALSAGMNVDGSVVVMENIFRHFHEARLTAAGRAMSAAEKLRILATAVSEVKLPLVASTLASLVVFLPLTFTSALSYAILGDLAKAVVFSHGFSAVVALILVPTVRFHLMSREKGVPEHRSFFEPMLSRIDALYARMLGAFVKRRWFARTTYVALAGALAALIAFVLPRLPREVIGTPDSDMLFMSLRTSSNSLLRQMEAQSDEVERDLLAEFGRDIDYTFTQINGPNRAWILAKLKDKGAMDRVWKAMEARFTDTPVLRFRVEPWNPSELPIPDPPDLRIAVRGGELEARRDVTLELTDMLETAKVFDRVYNYPGAERGKGVALRLDQEQWAALAQQGARLTPADLTDMARIATDGRRIARMTIDGRATDVNMRYPEGTVMTPEDLRALPVGVGPKLVPLGALVPLATFETPPPIYRENEQDVFLVYGTQNKSAKAGAAAGLARAKQLVAEWEAKREEKFSGKNAAAAKGQPVVVIEDAGKDVTQAIEQLGAAILISIGLIFLVLILQFGSIVESLLVLVAVPLGFIGVILALYLAGSTLSLNSALGVILLNGIAVNNSIIMVDFIRRLAASGMAPRAAAVEAARKRLRPILITSLTTILGMLPIAVGYGDGGRILQPLGIAVSGGLWISMALTLFLVPALQVGYLERMQRRAARTGLSIDAVLGGGPGSPLETPTVAAP